MNDQRIPIALFILRVGVFLLMAAWTIDKFIRPEHAASVFEKFYFLGGLGSTLIYVIGAIESVILVGFLLGYQKRLTYCAILVFRAISTLSSFRQYLAPFDDHNLLFFAAWRTLAACFSLCYLRDLDTKWAMSK